MTTLGIDIETFSSIDLTKSGVYKYVESPDFEIMLFAYTIDDSPVKIIHCVDLASGQQLPADVFEMLTNPAILKTAWNANFERTCISKQFGVYLDPVQWECSMAKAAMLSLPLGLDQASKVLKLSIEKDVAGKSLIRYFSMPCKPTKTNGERNRNQPNHAPEKWADFISYCIRDVEVEQAIREKIHFFEIPIREKKTWQLDQRINDAGILLDRVFIANAINQDTIIREKMTNEAVSLTGLHNPNSTAQLKKWFSEAFGATVTSLKKTDIPVMLELTTDEDVKRVLQLRQEMSKTSVKKYEAMRAAICEDSRVRGLLQFYGANRTGRWAGRLVQVQNLPQNHLPDLDLARKLVKENDLDTLELCFGNVPDTLSQLIRTSFIAPKGHRFIIADFSAIEARVIAWLSGEKWRLDVFKTHGKIYEASASQMFKVPIEQITKGSPLRQKGKVAELALGYQGGPNAMINMGALDMGLTIEELPEIVSRWRNANRKIVEYWNTVDHASFQAVNDGIPQLISHGIKFTIEKEVLFIQLPSKRRLAYLNPTIRDNRFGNASIVYTGMDQTTKQWTKIETYGGKLVENIVQAVARDCLTEAMLRLDAAGYKIVMHIHDEVVLEVPDDFGSMEEVNEIMSKPIEWAKDLPLTADSYETLYYKKD